MKCRKVEKWISDNIDEELSERKRKNVKEHLLKCSHCRFYKMTLEKIHVEVKNLDEGKAPDEYWENFSLRIKKKISSVEQTSKKFRPFASRLKLAWVGAGFVLLLIAGFSVIHFRAKTPHEIFIFFFEDSINQIYQEIGSNSELEDTFNLLVLDSIGEFLGVPREETVPSFYSLSSLWEEFTEEEISFLDSEIKNEIKS